MFRESELPVPFSGGRYTLVAVRGIGGMAMLYEADVDLERFDYAKVIAASEVDPDTGRRERLADAKSRYLDLRQQDPAQLRDYCERSGLPYPRSGKAAVKILLPQRVEGFQSRFRAEWQHLMAIHDEHLVEVYGGGLDKQHGVHYYAMELLLDLLPLKALYRLSVEDKLEFVRQAAGGLAALHRHGLIHRDVKPHNLICRQLAGGGLQVKVSDLGIAKETQAAVELTGSGETFGSVCYMPPEQARGAREATVQSDIYSLGATLYQLLAGRAPYEGLGQIEVLQRLSSRTPPIPLEELAGGVPPHLSAAVRRMMEFDPERRPSDLWAVQALLAGGTTVRKASANRRAARARGALPWVAAGVVGGLILLGLIALWQRSRSPEQTEQQVASRPVAPARQEPVAKPKPKPAPRPKTGSVRPPRPVTKAKPEPRPKPQPPRAPLSAQIKAALDEQLSDGLFEQARRRLARLEAEQRYAPAELAGYRQKVDRAQREWIRVAGYLRILERKADALHEQHRTGEAINALREALFWARTGAEIQRNNRKIEGYREATTRMLADKLSGAGSLLKTGTGRLVLRKKLALLAGDPALAALTPLVVEFQADLARSPDVALHDRWQQRIAAYPVLFPGEQLDRSAPACASCKSRGHHPCKECDDKGLIHGACQSCAARGRVGCAACRETGRVHCRKCRSGCLDCLGTAWQGCEQCAGRGWKPCAECDGMGRGSWRHRSCNGRKQVYCRACHGLGLELARNKRELPADLDRQLAALAPPADAPAPPTDNPAFRRRQVDQDLFVRRHGGTKSSQAAVLAGLTWLAQHQSPSGKWDGDGFQAQCKKNPCSGVAKYAWSDNGLTGLALLAFLGAGHTHRHGQFKQTVGQGLRHLLRIQDRSGLTGGEQGQYVITHALCTAALVEAYGLTQSPQLAGPARKALGCLRALQNPGSGWRDHGRAGESDVFVTTLALLVVRAADLADMAPHWRREALWGAESFIESVTDNSYYITGYRKRPARGWRGPTSSRYVAKNLGVNTGKSHARTHAPTAMATLARVYFGRSINDPKVRGGGVVLASMQPMWATGGGGPQSRIDYWYWHFGTLALFELAGRFDKQWRTWNANLLGALVPKQRSGGDEHGSWDPIDAWGWAGGRIYATAINTLTLETYYRWARRDKRR